MKKCNGCKSLVARLDSRGYCPKCSAQSLGHAAADKVIDAVIPKNVQLLIQKVVWIAMAGYVVYIFVF